MAGTNTLSKKQINEKLEEVDQKIKYGNIEDAVIISRKLYAAASVDPAVQMVMNNLSEIEQRANYALTQLDDSYGKLNWEQIYHRKCEIEILYCNHKVKKVIYLKLAGQIGRYNHITADALDRTLTNNWIEAEERVREVEKMDPDGIRSRKLRAFHDRFKAVCTSKKPLDYDCQQHLRELFKEFDLYRFSDTSPVFVNWRMDK